MNDDLDPGECYLLDALWDHTIPTAELHGPTLASLIGRGLVEITWAHRARLTEAGTDLFRVIA